jgi:large subunit ribosomal protein L1
MDKSIFLDTLKSAKAASPKRNFKQSVDLIINLKDLDLKKNENQIDMFVAMHYSTGKVPKICGLVGPELSEQAKSTLDFALLQDGFKDYKEKKQVKKLANQYDFFIAQANIMPQVAAAFGRVFGPRGKMPNPKAGCVVPPNANLGVLKERLKKMIRVSAKKDPLIQAMVGKDDQKEEEVVDNIMTLYNQLIQALPNERHNIKSMFLKLTMGKPVRVGSAASETDEEEQPKKKKAKKAAEKPAAEPADNNE